MFINKIGRINNKAFTSLNNKKNEVGETIPHFNFVYDNEKQTCELSLYRLIPQGNGKYKIIETPIGREVLDADGKDINLQKYGIGKNEAYAYKFTVKDKESGEVVYDGPDTGVKIAIDKDNQIKFRNNYDRAGMDFQDSIKNYRYTFVSQKGTTPRMNGAAYLAMPDSFNPAAIYRGFNEDNTGEIYLDNKYQKEMESVKRTFSNKFGGSIAGLEEKIPYLKENGYKILFTTPIANGDDVSSHGYWNKNNMQMAANMGNLENFKSFTQKLFANGIKYVYDGTFTSEGLEGIHVQYALRWAHRDAQTTNWFSLDGLKDSNIGFGVIPENKENMAHRIINSPYIYTQENDGKITKKPNPDYNPEKETIYQIYDASQTSNKQVQDLDNVIRKYENIKNGSELDINTHEDTVISYAFQIDPVDYDNNIDVLNEYNKNAEKKVNFKSPEGTIMVSNFPTFKIYKKSAGGYVAWDSLFDLVKVKHHISGADEKNLQSIVDPAERDYKRKLIERGTIEARDCDIQAVKYWTNNVNDIQTLYAAKTLAHAKTINEIEQLVKDGKLPSEINIDNKTLNNILNGEYLLAPKGVMEKDDITVKSMMKLPLDSLEFGENTVGVLSTSFFSNRATKEEQLGSTRFDLLKQGNPQLVEPYSKNYNKVNDIFNNQLKSFMDSVISKMNETSDEKLLDVAGNYTEYGEYVAELIGKNIAKYALLKSLSGESFKAKTLDNGEITYDYENIKKATTLKSLNINASSPEEEAEILENKLEKGLRNISTSDVEIVADAMLKQIAGTDTNSFRIAEAVVDRAGLGLCWRLDAAKDVIDMDSVRNGETDFDDAWQHAIEYWSKMVETIKGENPSAYIVAEITDIADLMRNITGTESCPYGGNTDIGKNFNGEPDAMIKFLNETGITSEAGYSYFFTELLQSFDNAFDSGKGFSPTHDSFRDKLDLLMQTRSVDYIRNLYTFMSNHDKPRMLHGFALDMNLFYSDLRDPNNIRQRLDAMQVLSGAKNIEDIPVAQRLLIKQDEYRDNMDPTKDYFRLVSTRAVAMSKLLMNSVNNSLENIASQEDINNIKSAIIDLTNGNYLGSGETYDYSIFNIKELQTLENSFNEILKIAENKYNLNLSDKEKNELSKKVLELAKKDNFLKNYIVQGDLDWTEPREIGMHNRELAYKILNKTNNTSNLNNDNHQFDKYSIYTISLGALIRDAYDVVGSKKSEDAIYSAIKDFAEKYNKETVNQAKISLPKTEDTKAAVRKNMYGAIDIKQAITMAIKQVEFKTGKEINNREKIIETLYQASITPALAKSTAIMEFLSALPGTPAMYAGDEFGMSGYDEKTKNVYIPRNVTPWSEAEKRKDIIDRMNSAMDSRKDNTLHSLNDGTPYSLDVCVDSKNRDEICAKINELNGKISELEKEYNSTKDEKIKLNIEKSLYNLKNEKRELTRGLARIAYLMQGENGDMTVSILNAADVVDENNQVVTEPQRSEIDYLTLAGGISLPIGMIFMNANSKDKTEYVVKDLGKNARGIARKDGKKIVMDKFTSKNGVMILKHIKKIMFRGHNTKTYYNPQYNFAPQYNTAKTSVKGERLSILSK